MTRNTEKALHAWAYKVMQRQLPEIVEKIESTKDFDSDDYFVSMQKLVRADEVRTVLNEIFGYYEHMEITENRVCPTCSSIAEALQKHMQGQSGLAMCDTQNLLEHITGH